MNSKWTDQEIDAALCEESDSILPSSGFLDAVMAEVRSEASALPAIPFPWKRALPGLAGSAIVFIALLAVTIVGWTSAQARSDSLPEWQALSVSVAGFLERPATLWTIVCTLLAFFCLAITRQLASVR